MNFVHLHTHSHYSLLDGLGKIDALLNRAKSLNMKSLALTDHGAMYGVIEFYQKAKEMGIKPILGIEIYVAKYGMLDKRPKIDSQPYHLVLLAKNRTGYQNLIKLTTKAHLEGFYYKPRIDHELLKKHSEGLIALTACLDGAVPRAILNNDYKKAQELALMYQDIFGKENFYLELQDHPNTPNQKIANEQLIELSKRLNIPLVATNDIHYTNPEDKEPHDILLCIQTQKKVTDKNRLSMKSDDFSMKSLEEMMNSFKNVPDAIENTSKIAEKCNLEFEFGKPQIPYFEVPGKFNANTYLRELCYKGLKERYKKDVSKISAEVLERLEYELSTIEQTGFAPYFLIVQDFVNWAKNNNIVVGPGRGSGAASLVSYLLNITDLDPIKYELIFERFLNPERISMPDFDIDFADDRRDKVIEYVTKKYGREKVAQIITFGTMAARAAVRDAGRALGYAYSFCDQIAKMIPMFSSLEDALNNVQELKSAYDQDTQAKKLIDSAKKLEGVARHASTHACGVVITKDNIDNYVPTQHASQDDKTIITQYSLHPIEDLGLLKMDFLGLKNLTILQNALRIIRKTKEREISLSEVPLDDPDAFKLLQKAKTTGVFQLESPGMKRYLKQLKPTKFEDIIAMVALFRPGPMDWIPDFIAGKHGKKKTTYLHPKLEPILEKTYGIAVYQEQVLQIARELAGFTLGEADVLRKAVGKKIPKLLAEQREKFIKGAVRNNVPKEIAERIFSFIEPFAGYGFNRAHAACYAMIAYQTAYLKSHFPEEFMASLLTSDQNNTDRVAIEVTECEQMGIKVLPPHINESFGTFTVIKHKPHTIRFGLAAIKNVGDNIVENIVEERKKNGRYKDLDDFLKRVFTKDLNKKSMESLIKCGAMDSFGERNQMLENIDQILNYNKNYQKAHGNGQIDLFSTASNIYAAPKLRLKKTESASKKQRLSWEKELLGLYVSEHPVEEFRNYLEKYAVPTKKLDQNTVRKRVKIGGIINKIKRIITRTGEPMLFVQIEDLSGGIEILVFPSILKNTLDIWQEGKIVIAQGTVSDKDGTIKLLCNEVVELNEKTSKNPPKLQTQKNYYNGYQIYNNTNHITVEEEIGNIYIQIPKKSDPSFLVKIRSLLSSTPKGSYKVLLSIPNGNAENDKLETEFKINAKRDIIENIEKLVGKGRVIVEKLSV